MGGERGALPLPPAQGLFEKSPWGSQKRIVGAKSTGLLAFPVGEGGPRQRWMRRMVMVIFPFSSSTILRMVPLLQRRRLGERGNGGRTRAELARRRPYRG
jgi:hypothetical protein